jgi:hypothetical protein
LSLYPRLGFPTGLLPLGFLTKNPVRNFSPIYVPISSLTKHTYHHCTVNQNTAVSSLCFATFSCLRCYIDFATRTKGRSLEDKLILPSPIPPSFSVSRIIFPLYLFLRAQCEVFNSAYFLFLNFQV